MILVPLSDIQSGPSQTCMSAVHVKDSLPFLHCSQICLSQKLDKKCNCLLIFLNSDRALRH